MSDSLWPHGLQHARIPCPSLSPGVCSNSNPLSWRCYQPSHPVTPFSSCPQPFPASEPFPVSQLFTSGGQSIGALALASVHPMNSQGWFPLGLTGLISLQSKGLSRVFSSTIVRGINSSVLSFFIRQVSCPYLTGKIIALATWTFVSKVMSLLFNTYLGLS